MVGVVAAAFDDREACAGDRQGQVTGKRQRRRHNAPDKQEVAHPGGGDRRMRRERNARGRLSVSRLLVDLVAERAELIQLQLIELHFLGFAPDDRRLVEIGVDGLVHFGR